jgi:hypothetical protein
MRQVPPFPPCLFEKIIGSLRTLAAKITVKITASVSPILTVILWRIRRGKGSQAGKNPQGILTSTLTEVLSYISH